MANDITKFKKYIDLLDEVYKSAALTAVLDGDPTLVRAGANANEIIIPKMVMDGLANYSRTSGYVAGDVDLTNETVQFNYDRGRKFTVDAMDNEETAGVAFGRLAAEFIRTKVVPEMDAARFAQYCGTSNISTVSAAALSSGNDTLAALIAAQNQMDEDEVPQENRFLFITPTLYNGVANVDTTKSKEVLASFSTIKKVPQSRFYTAIDLKDGTTSGEEAGGYAKNANAKDINFLVVHKAAVLQYAKHTVNKVIAPDVNQSADGWSFYYRAYGLMDVYDNKVDGIYLHILLFLINGIISAIPQLIEMVPQIVMGLLNALISNLPMLIEAGIQIILALINGLINALPQLIEQIPVIVSAIINALINNLPLLIQMGIQIIVSLAGGLIKAIPQLILAAGQLVNSLVQAFASAIGQFFQIGANIVSGIWSGIQSGWDWLTSSVSNLAQNLLQAAKNALGIKSPSTLFRDQIGKNIALGIAVGILGEAQAIQNALASITDVSAVGGAVATARSLASTLRTGGGGATTNNIGGDTFNIYTQKLSPAEMLAEAQYQRERKAMTLVPA